MSVSLMHAFVSKWKIIKILRHFFLITCVSEWIQGCNWNVFVTVFFIKVIYTWTSHTISVLLCIVFVIFSAFPSTQVRIFTLYTSFILLLNPLFPSLSFCVPLDLSIPYTKSQSEYHYMSNTICTHTNTGSSPRSLAGIEGKPSSKSTNTFIHPSTKAPSITTSPLAEPKEALDMWSTLQSVNDCGPALPVTWIGCWWLQKRFFFFFFKGAVSVTCYLWSLKQSLLVP